MPAAKNSCVAVVCQDIFQEGTVQLVRLEPIDIIALVDVAALYHLDFDDAYQYVAAEKYQLVIVSFDSDFDITARGRQTPGQVLASPVR